MDKIRTTGVIDKVIYGETGNVRYYVNTEVNGETISVKSPYYSSKTKSLPEGEDVVVDYIVSSKGVSSVEILNEDIILCKDDMGGELRVLAGFGVLVLIIIAISMIKNIFGMR